MSATTLATVLRTAIVTSITLRATLVGGHPVYESVTAKGGLSAQGPGIASCGHTVNGLDYGNWYIRKIIISPIAINAKSWSALVKVPEAAPDPSLIRTVEAALIKMQQSPNHRMYSASEILTDWI